MSHILRRIFPAQATCDNCGHQGHPMKGSSRTGVVRYATCPRCGRKHKIVSLGYEEDLGQGRSRLVPTPL